MPTSHNPAATAPDDEAMQRIARLWRADLSAAEILREHGFELDRGAAWPVAPAIACLSGRPGPRLAGAEAMTRIRRRGGAIAPDIAAIARATALPRTTVRRALDRLLARGLVELMPSPQDGRQRLVHPTPRFDAVMETLSQSVEQCYHRAFDAAEEDGAPGWAQALMERLGEAAILTDAPPPGAPPRVVAVNSAFEALTGYRRSEILGKSPAMLQGPDTHEAIRARLRHAIDARQPARETLTNYRKDGSSYLCELTLEPLSAGAPQAGERGAADFFLGTARDVG